MRAISSSSLKQVNNISQNHFYMRDVNCVDGCSRGRKSDRQTDVPRLTNRLLAKYASNAQGCGLWRHHGVRSVTSLSATSLSSPFSSFLSLQWGCKPGSLPCPGHFLFVVCEPVPALRFTALGIIQNKCSKQLPAPGEVVLDKFNRTSKRDIDYNANGG